MSAVKTHLIYLFLLLPALAALDFENCLVKESYNQKRPKYTFRNCSDNSYCCDAGCCSLLWYTGPLAVFLVILVICCVTCVKACWDVYHENVHTVYDYEGARVRFEAASSNVQVIMSPPPAYNVAIFLPQPSATNRIPSYEEVMGET
ncbi:hypothetical protein Zmor_016496 [Zophobas morio]|uniref:Uncharacterized protein n=1 Tax=Zophobas morio TaxID=2755281 RepID=A0AA38MBI1_9CUCU|nr:hypothetical protein Zmor_016496 [Zophobas morio]